MHRQFLVAEAALATVATRALVSGMVIEALASRGERVIGTTAVVVLATARSARTVARVWGIRRFVLSARRWNMPSKH